MQASVNSGDFVKKLCSSHASLISKANAVQNSMMWCPHISAICLWCWASFIPLLLPLLFSCHFIVTKSSWCMEAYGWIAGFVSHLGAGWPPGGLLCERGEGACQKIWIEPLKVTNMGVAQALFWTLKDIVPKRETPTPFISPPTTPVGEPLEISTMISVQCT